MTKATEAKWQSRVAEWRASGETAEAFAAGKGYEASTLRFWSSQLRRKGAGVVAAAEPTVTMARVVRARSTMSAAGVTVTVGRASVVVTRGFDAELLREVIAALGGAS
jgi:transposase